MNKFSVNTTSLTQPTTPNTNSTKKLLSKNRLRAKAKHFRPKTDSFDETEKINMEIKKNWQREMLFSNDQELRPAKKSTNFTSVLF